MFTQWWAICMSIKLPKIYWQKQTPTGEKLGEYRLGRVWLISVATFRVNHLWRHLLEDLQPPPYRIYMQGRAVWTGMNYGVIRMPRRFGHGCLLDGPILGHNSDLLKIKAAAVSRESFLFYLTGTKGLLRDTKIVPKSHKWAKRRKESRESIKNACISQQPLVLDGPGKGKKLC